MMINRSISDAIIKRLFKGKVLLVFGARQTGKSTLADTILTGTGKDWLALNGDEADIREILSNTTSTQLRSIIGNKKIVLIDEAQRIENVGLTLKIMVDQLKDVQVIATGSSSFELANKVNEPLTGRAYSFMLYPLSFQEMVDHHGLLEEKRMVEHRMLYGYYPEIVTHPGEEIERLTLLAESYLYKDLLTLDNIKKPAVLQKLLHALALQIGSEVSLTELSQVVGTDRKTVEKYIDLLEKAFVIFHLPAFARNVRNEIKKGKKIYFYDCGIRNAIINDFKAINSRTDLGGLWENFAIAERIKYINNNGRRTKFYFWRTAQQQEIDLVEEEDNELSAVEIKWNKKAKGRMSATFSSNYPGAGFSLVTKENFPDFVQKK